MNTMIRSMAFADDEDIAAEAIAVSVPVAASEPLVIAFNPSAGGGIVYWSEIERSCVAPSGDVTFYHSRASAERILADLQTRFAAEAAGFSIDTASALSMSRRATAAALGSPASGVGRPPEDDDRELLDICGAYEDDHEVDGDGYYLDDDDDRIEDNRFPGGYARRIYKEAAAPLATVGDCQSVGGLFRADGDQPLAAITGSGAGLVGKFGPPGDGDGWKSALHWNLKFSDGQTATIYEWKSSSLFDDDLADPQDILGGVSDWRVVGSSPDVVDRIKTILAA